MSVICASAHQVDKICRQLDAVCTLALTKVIKSSGELFLGNMNCDSPVRFYEFLVLCAYKYFVALDKNDIVIIYVLHINFFENTTLSRVSLLTANIFESGPMPTP